VSDEGYGANDYIETQKPIVIVTGPGRKRKAGNILLSTLPRLSEACNPDMPSSRHFPYGTAAKHPINVLMRPPRRYQDFNMIDPFHLEAYDRKAVNYNRDVEVFPVLKRLWRRSTGGKTFTNSPTDMGVNRCRLAITDEKGSFRGCDSGDHRRFPLPVRIRHGLHGQGTVERVSFSLRTSASSRSTAPWSSCALRCVRPRNRKRK